MKKIKKLDKGKNVQIVKVTMKTKYHKSYKRNNLQWTNSQMKKYIK